jgi:hypothetical protein
MLMLDACGNQQPVATAPISTATPTSPPSHFTPVGTIDGLIGDPNCTVIGGWVWDKSQPDAPITVEVYDVTALLATIVADRFGQDLLDAHIGNGKHFFSFTIPKSLKDSQPHLIRVKVAKTDIELRNSSKFISCPPT